MKIIINILAGLGLFGLLFATILAVSYISERNDPDRDPSFSVTVDAQPKYWVGNKVIVYNEYPEMYPNLYEELSDIDDWRASEDLNRLLKDYKADKRSHLYGSEISTTEGTVVLLRYHYNSKSWRYRVKFEREGQSSHWANLTEFGIKGLVPEDGER